MTKQFTLGLATGLTLAVAGIAWAEARASVNTNGRLVGYIVQKDGEEVCRDPMVWNQFHGPDSYIVCN